MIKKVLHCKDYDGNDYIQTCWFDLSQAELFEMDLEERGLQAKLRAISESEDSALMVQTFKKLIVAAYGVRPADNPRAFIKNDKVREEFFQSPAYTALLIELLKDKESMETFFKGVVSTIPTQDSVPAPVNK